MSGSIHRCTRPGCKRFFTYIENLERHRARNKCGVEYDPLVVVDSVQRLNLNTFIDPPFKDMKAPTPEPRLRTQPSRSTRVTRGNANQTEKQQVIDEVPSARDKVFQCDCGKRYGYRESIYNHKKHGKCTGKPWGSAIILSIPANSANDDSKEAYKRRKVNDDSSHETESKDSSSSPAPVMQASVRQHRSHTSAQPTQNQSPVEDSSHAFLPTLPPLSAIEERKPDVSLLVQQPMIVHPPPTTIQYPTQPLYNNMAPPSIPAVSSTGSTPTPESANSKKPMTRVRQPEHEKAFACDCGKRFAYKTSIYHHKNRGGCPGRPWVTSEGGHRNRAKTGKHLSMSRAHELAQKMGEIGTLNVDFDNVPDHLKAEFYKSESLNKAVGSKRKKSSFSNASESSSSAPGGSQDDVGSGQNTRQQRPSIGLKIREWKEPHPRQLGRPTLARQQLEQEMHAHKPSLLVQSSVVTPPTNQIPDTISQSPSSPGVSQPSFLSMQPTSHAANSAPSSTGNVDEQSNALASSQQGLHIDSRLNNQEDSNRMKRRHSTPPLNRPPLASHPFTRNNTHLATYNNHSYPSIGSVASPHASMDQDDGADSDAYVYGDVDVDDETCVSKTRWGPAGAELAHSLVMQRFNLPKPASPTLARPYVCLVPGCGRSYKNSNGLAAHFSSVREQGHGELGRKLRDEAKEKDINPGFVGIFDSITKELDSMNYEHPHVDEPEPED